MTEFDLCQFTGKIKGKHTMLECVRTYATACAWGSRVTATNLICDVQIKYCYIILHNTINGYEIALYGTRSTMYMNV